MRTASRRTVGLRRFAWVGARLRGGVGRGALGEGMAGAELGDELGGVDGGVDGEGFGDDEERLGEFADGELFARAL